MINDANPLSVRTATAADRFMIRRWLADPEIEAWWGSSASVEAEIALATESSSSLCRIIECDGRPIGYAQAVDVGIWSDQVPKELPAACWDIDLFIGSAEHRARGHTGVALELLAEEVFATTLALACCIFVSVKNEPAVRAYERAGFRWICIWHDRISGPNWVLLKERPRS
jgi:predicted GNAT family acetyltransferase